MKKTKVLAAVVILAMALVGTSYAMITDSADINNSISTGIMDVQIHESSSLIDSQGVIAELHGSTINMKNLVPGGYAIFNLVFENKGDLDIEVDKIRVNIEENNELEKYINLDCEHIGDELKFKITLHENTPNSLQNEHTSFNIVANFKQIL